MAPVASELLREAESGLVQIPKSAFQLRDQDSGVQIEQGGEKKKRQFSMVATTGKPLDHWWFGKLVIDLAGIAMKQSLPVLKDHDTNQRVGFTTSLQVDEKRGLVAEGQLLSNQFAQEILADHADGFPWQASIYLQASRIQYLEEGESAQVNGRTVDGPAAIFRESTLREVTFCALGVDDDTSATPMSAALADTVAVTLSKRTPAMTKTEAPVANPPTPAPAPHDLSAQLSAARNEGLIQERQRVLAILAQAGEGQHDIALAMIEQGKTLQDALLAINQDLRSKLSAKPAAAASESPSLARGNTSNVVKNDPSAKLAAMPEGEPKWRAEYEASVELQAEFGGDVELYLGFKRNEENKQVAKGSR